MESKTKKLYQLIEEWTRAEIMARHGKCVPRDWGTYFQIKLDKEDEIKKLVFGSSDLIVLGTRWKLLGTKKKLKANRSGCQNRLEFINPKKGDTKMVKARVKKMKAKQAKKAKKKSHKKAGSNRPVGRTSGVGVTATWILVMQHNTKVSVAKRRTDAQITAYMKKEFPGRKTAYSYPVQFIRNRYNKGAFTKGVVPKRQAVRHGE